MADKPILFSAPMVRALLAGTKTQTRRLYVPKPDWGSDVIKAELNALVWPIGGLGQQCGAPSPLPRICVGDRLYVREAWRPGYNAEGWNPELGRVARPSDFDPKTTAIEYLADGTNELGGSNRPGIHMPRWASRLTLLVTEVRVARLQDISEADAEAEGCPECSECHGAGWIHSGPDGGWQCTAPGCGDAYVDQYARLWDSINGPGAWDANPWVAAYSFSVHHHNIDQVQQ